MSDRTVELAANLAEVHARIDAACRSAGRDPAEVTLVVVTKTWPADDVRLLAGLGVRDVGENRDQEAAPKAVACAGLGLRWHFVGQLQSNKAKSVVRYADVVHSVDRPHLVRALAAAAESAGRRVGCLVQVRLEPVEGRGGAAPGDALALAAQIVGAAALDLLGVMAVAPLGEPPERAFARLAEVAAAVRREHPDATWVSAGMSGDLEAAVAAGATHVRVGTAVLGRRPPLG
ncbi:MAG TPA: YggS family pyridoxal phosphate-dependent enzyme [Actinomycetes bacterium]